MNTKIYGTGSCVPEQVVTNDDLSKTLDTSDEWIRTRTGIERRHIAEEEETASVLAVKAAQRALENADVQPEEIDAILVATSSGDYAFPNTASIVQAELGADNAACFDISAACTGFIYALSVANAYIQSGMYKKVLVIGAEVMSSLVDWTDRSVCVLFGDGAGAVVLGESDTGKQITRLHSNGGKAKVLTAGREKEEYIKMDGQEVFRFAVKKVPESIEEVLEEAKVSSEEIKYFILHQANVRIIEGVAKRLKLSMDKFPVNLKEYGNTSAASIPILLDELNKSKKLERGDKLVLSGFGAGLSWGSTFLQW